MASVTIRLHNYTNSESDYRVYVKEHESNYAPGVSGTISGLTLGTNYTATGSRAGWAPHGKDFTLATDYMTIDVDMERG